MAKIDVERKDKKENNKNNTNWWIWAVVAIIAIVVAWIALDDRTDVQREEVPMEDTTTYTEEILSIPHNRLV